MFIDFIAGAQPDLMKIAQIEESRRAIKGEKAEKALLILDRSAQPFNPAFVFLCAFAS